MPKLSEGDKIGFGRQVIPTLAVAGAIVRPEESKQKIADYPELFWTLRQKT